MPRGVLRLSTATFLDILAGYKRDTYHAARDPPPVLFEKHLEFLRALMRRAVILCGRQQARVVPEVKPVHQRRNKLVGGKTPERAIFGRDEDVETPRWRSDERFLFETVQRELGGIGRNAQSRLGLARGKVIAPFLSKAADIFSGIWMMARFSFHTRKVSLSDTLRARISLRSRIRNS